MDILLRVISKGIGHMQHQSDFKQDKQPVNLNDSSSSSEGVEEVTGRTRVNWTELENQRLLSAWCHHSIDAVKGTDQKAEHYWKAVAVEFNSNTPEKSRKRTALQCKTHWGGLKRDISKFCGAYAKVRNTYVSGQSEDMVMEKAHQWYKGGNKQKPFTLEYLWRDVKDLPKWRRLLAQEEETKNKRTKLSESGAYTSSSNHDTEEETVGKQLKRPEGQKKAKAKLKAKGKNISPSPLGEQPTQNMVLYHQASSLRAEATIKAAEATAKAADARIEEARTKKLLAYIKLSEKDTSGYNEADLKRHEAIVDKLLKEI
ncbi:glutathione S-transferase T3-like [Panicum virgatum]|uniref:glutathione S-transferase T3-like n=1 Tax=Panicum virgatum TaxID=38727 RepID=UPI0019D5BE1F|nr:glutathione S-transferase T3-like [Panicum virgatum]